MSESQARNPELWIDLWAADPGALRDEVAAAAEAGAQGVYAEVADPSWNGTVTLGPRVLEAVAQGPLPVCASVRTLRPDVLIGPLAGAGCAMIAFDAAAPIHLHRALMAVRGAGASPAVSLTPSTPLTRAEYLLAEADAVVLDGAEPGQPPGALMEPLCERVRILKEFLRAEKGSKRLIAAGLGTPYDAARVWAAGGDVFTVGAAALSKEGLRAYRADLQARRNALRGKT